MAIIVLKGAFKEYKISKSNRNSITREKAIQTVSNYLTDEGMIVSTTGKSSCELFEYREAKKQSHKNDFLTVGSMGYSYSIALELL